MQTELFPEAAKIKELKIRIADLYDKCTSGLNMFSDYGKFLKTFGEYAKSLNARKESECVELNLKTVERKLSYLTESLAQFKKDLAEAHRMEKEIAELEAFLDVPTKYRTSGLGYEETEEALKDAI